MQVRGAAAHGLAFAPGQDHHLDARRVRQHQARAVLDGKFFQFVAGGVIVHAPVGHRAVHIQHQQADHTAPSRSYSLGVKNRSGRPPAAMLRMAAATWAL